MALTDTAAKNAKPDKDKPAGHKLADANGLFLLVKPAGKYWRMDYTSPGGKRNTLAIGVYPTVSLSAARKARDAARALLAQGSDPAIQAHRIARPARQNPHRKNGHSLMFPPDE